MRTRLISLLTAGALVISSLVIGGSLAQADDETPVTGSISGRVILPAGHSFTGTNTVQATVFGDGLQMTTVSGTINADGSYTIAKVLPDTPYIVYAVPGNMAPNDLLTTFYGGWATHGSDMLSINMSSDVATVSVPSGTQGKTDVDITMAQGSYIQGTIYTDDGTPVSSPDASSSGVFCETGSGYSSASISDDGTYSCLAIPGEIYQVSAYTDGYWRTYYGGYVGTFPASKASTVTKVTAAPAGQSVTNIDITMGKQITVTGTVLPASVIQAGDVNVFLCPTSTEDGQTSFVASSRYRENDWRCWGTTVPAGSDGTYSIQVFPDIDYAVIGQTDGYTNAWHGGYVGGLTITSDSTLPTQVVPPAGVALVSGSSGEMITGADILFGAPVSVTFDPDGGTPTLGPISVASGSTVALPADPTKDGYTFAGWNTKEDGTGNTFDASTIVSGSLTVYAQWTPVVGSTITGTINGNLLRGHMAWVFACPTYSTDGTGYYVARASGVNDDSSFYADHSDQEVIPSDYLPLTTSPSNDRDEVPDSCITATPTSEDTYSVDVVPGVDYAVLLSVWNTNDVSYQDAWHGGYYGNAGLGPIPTSDTMPDPADQVLPDRGVLLVRGAAGETVEGVDIPGIEYAEAVTVTFDAQGGTPIQDAMTIAQGGTVVLPTDPTKDGYTFGGWYTQKDGGGTQFTADTVVDADVTVYARWTQQADVGYTFGCDSPTSVGSVNHTFVAIGDVLPVIWSPGGCDGYTFESWNTKEDGSGTPYAPGDSLTVTGNVTLFAQWVPVSTPPVSEVEKQDVVASTTGGASRLADGKDSYSLVTTLTSGEGLPMAGLADHLAVVVPANVTASSFVDNNDGTYTVQVESSVPGNYVVTVTLDGDAVGSPIPVNFIGASIEEQVRAPGESQSATGLGFLPGEQVTVTVHSDPIELGVKTADTQGRVLVTFDVPSDFALGHHTVDFAGAVSGTVSTGFSVAVPAAGEVSGVETGGTVQSHGSLLLLAGVLVVAGLAVQRLRHPRAAKRG